MKIGNIFLRGWENIQSSTYEIIENIYGKIGNTIGASYHALVYLEITDEVHDVVYYVGIESTIGEPYKLQFCVETNKPDFMKLLKARYQCKYVFITYDCNRIDMAGGKSFRRFRKHRHNKTIKNK